MTNEQTSTPPVIKVLAIGLLVTGVLMVGSLTAIMLSSSSHAAPAMQPDPAFEGVVFPTFEGVNQAGEPVSGDALTGEVTIVDFFFSRCPLICPEMTTRMMEQTEALKGTDVKFLSISVDPAHDTPEVMAEFSERYGANPRRWTFARTSTETLTRVAERIGFAIQTNAEDPIPAGPDETMPNIIHPTSMLLVGPDRKIYGRYYYKSPDDLSQLSLDAKRLLDQR